MTAIEAGRVIVRLEGRDVGLSDLLKRIENQFHTGVSATREYDTAVAQLGPNQKRVEGDALGYAQALARVAEKTGDAAGAQAILIKALQQVSANTPAAQSTVLQLQGTIDRTAQAAKQASQPITNFAQTFQKFVGAFFAFQVGTNAAAGLINLANDAEKTDITFRALSVTQEEYGRNLAIAKKQQELFGGSMQENQDNLQGFIFTARTAKVPLEEITNVARKLAIIDPAQGFKGASIALKEFFSGDITSLSRRFELPRGMLNGINQLGAGADKITALNAALEKMGITNELVAGQTRTNAVEFEKLKGAITDAAVIAGDTLVTVLLPAIKQVTEWIKQVPNLKLLGNTEEQAQKITFHIGAVINTYDTLEGANDRLNQSMKTLRDDGMQALIAGQPVLFNAYNDIANQIPTLTQSQYDFAQALLNTGASAEVVGAKILATVPIQQKLNDLSAQYGNASLADIFYVDASAADAFQGSILRVATASAEGAAFILGLVQALQEHQITLEQAQAAVQGFINGHEELFGVSGKVTGAIGEENAAFAEEIQKKLDSELASQKLKDAQDLLTQVAVQVRSGLLTEAEGAALLANQLNLTAEETAKLLSITLQLHSALDKKANASVSKPKAITELYYAQRDYNYQVADSAGKIRLLKNELNKLVPGTAAYIKKLTELDKLQDSLDKKGKKPKAPKLSDNQKIENKLLAQEDKIEQKIEDAKKKHFQKLADIEADYYKKIQEQRAKNEVSKRTSRADFYDSLAEVPEGIDPAKYAAMYETAFAEAQKIAQNGQAKLAEDYLSLKEKHIEEIRKLDEEAAKVTADKDISEGDRAKRLENINARKKLREEAQAEEEKNLKDGGDSINKEYKDQLDGEAKAYDDSLTNIETSSDRATTKIVVDAERRRIAVSNENKELAKTVGLYDDIEGKTKTPSASTDTAPVVESQPATADPIPVAATEALLVSQASTWNVFDEGVLNSIVDQTERLELKLSGIKESIDTGIVALGVKVDSLKSALRTNNSQNLVQH